MKINNDRKSIQEIINRADEIKKSVQANLSPVTLNKIRESFMIFERNRNSIIDRLKPLLRKASKYQKYLENTKDQLTFLSSIVNSKTFEHEVFFTVFGLDSFSKGFDEKDIEDNWDKIKDFLKKRWPNSLMSNNREERLEQIFKAQDAKAYIAVCRSTYPEIECLLREEILFKNYDFIKKYKLEDKNSRQLIDKELSKIKKNPNESFGIKEDISLHEIDICSATFLYKLVDIFESFDPKMAEEENLQNNRHFHCHGWSKKADFIDALNALLILDMTMYSINQLEKSSDKI